MFSEHTLNWKAATNKNSYSASLHKYLSFMLDIFKSLKVLHLICIILFKQREYWPSCLPTQTSRNYNHFCSYIGRISLLRFQKQFCFLISEENWGFGLGRWEGEMPLGLRRLKLRLEESVNEWLKYSSQSFVDTVTGPHSLVNLHLYGTEPFDPISYYPGNPQQTHGPDSSNCFTWKYPSVWVSEQEVTLEKGRRSTLKGSTKR